MNAAPNSNPNLLYAAISLGDLLDRISILGIKAQRISDPRRLQLVRSELELLRQAVPTEATSPEIDTEFQKLGEVNRQLWDIEDALRDLERDQRFDSEFVELARSVYRVNDRRASVKRKINELSGSVVQEVKSYANYQPPPNESGE